jgi:virginiamycin A acetyltransferase
MKDLLKYIINIITNSTHLLKIIATKKGSFNYVKSEIIDCEIDVNTKLYEPYRIGNSSIGFGTYISENAIISFTSIGKFCSIGPNLICGWGIHPINGISTSPVFYSTLKQAGFTYSKTNKIEERKPIIIGNDVLIGANVTTLDGITIGDGAVIGGGAIVSKDIPPYAVAVGCPISIIKYRFEPEIIEKLLSLKWWDKNKDVLKSVENNFFNVDDFLNEINRLKQ